MPGGGPGMGCDGPPGPGHTPGGGPPGAIGCDGKPGDGQMPGGGPAIGCDGLPGPGQMPGGGPPGAIGCDGKPGPCDGYDSSHVMTPCNVTCLLGMRFLSFGVDTRGHRQPSAIPRSRI